MFNVASTLVFIWVLQLILVQVARGKVEQVM